MTEMELKGVRVHKLRWPSTLPEVMPGGYSSLVWVEGSDVTARACKSRQDAILLRGEYISSKFRPGLSKKHGDDRSTCKGLNSKFSLTCGQVMS